MEIDAETVLDMLKRAELIGGWKVLNWLSFEFHKDMTAEDIVDTVDYAIALFSEELWGQFNIEHAVLQHLEDRMKERLKEKVKVTGK